MAPGDPAQVPSERRAPIPGFLCTAMIPLRIFIRAFGQT